MSDQLDLAALNQKFELLSPQDILAWACESFAVEDIVASSSFQTQSTPLLHMISQVSPVLPVIFLDTGFHFPETLLYCDMLQKRYNLNIHTVHPQISQSELYQKYGERLYTSDPDLCCYINKVEPMQRAVKGARAWISGVRRDQTATRSELPILERQPDGLLKIHPMLNWTRHDIWWYINQHDLIEHPLLAQGYLSVGCAPCTRPIQDDDAERSGRWQGTDKDECGLHLPSFNEVAGQHDTSTD